MLLTTCSATIHAQDYSYSYRRIQNSLLFSLDYSNHRYLNNPATEELSQPYFLSGLSFYSKRNFDISLQGGITLNSDTSYSESSAELSMQAGYFWDLSPSFKIRPSYSHFAFSKNSHPLHSLISDIFQLDIVYQKKWYYGVIYNSYLLGEKNTYYSTLKNGMSYTCDKLLRKDFLFGISFEANLMLGDKNYYNQILFDYWDALDLAYWGTEQFSISAETLYDRIIDEGLDEVKDWMVPMLEQLEPGLFDASFTFLFINLGVPLAVTYKRLHLQVFPMLMIPTSSSRFYEQDIQLMVTMGVAFSIL